MDREMSFDYDAIGMGESDDEIGDDEQPKGIGSMFHICMIKYM